MLHMSREEESLQVWDRQHCGQYSLLILAGNVGIAYSVIQTLLVSLP